MALNFNVIPQASVVADGYKYAISGSLVGVALSGVSEALGDWLVDMAGIQDNKDFVHIAANTVIRLSVTTGAFLVADRMLRAVGPASADPTGGLFFHAGFLFGQQPLVNAFADMSAEISHRIKTIVGISCCKDCAAGQPCPSEY